MALRGAWKPGGIQVALRGQLEGPDGLTKAPKRLQVDSKRRSKEAKLGPRVSKLAPRGVQETPS